MGIPMDCESSGDEEDANWKAAIDSIASTTTFGNKVSASVSQSASNRDVDEQSHNPQKLKHCQLKAQKLLEKILENTIEIVSQPIHEPDNLSADDAGVRLFKGSPLGIVFDHRVEIQGPKKKPKLLPGYGIDENSKKFRQKLKSIAVDGVDIIAAAGAAGQKALARLESKEAAAKAKAKEEEERIAELKRIRGERWLPSIAKEMQMNKNLKKPV